MSSAVESRTHRVDGVDLVEQHARIGQLAERPADLPQQGAHGTREAVVLEQEAHDGRTLDRAADGAPVHLQARQRLEHAHPQQVVVGRSRRPRRPPISTAAARTPRTRVVMSARSSARPSRHIAYASSWLIVVARIPSMRRLSLTTWRDEAVAGPPVGAAIGLDVDVVVEVVDAPASPRPGSSRGVVRRFSRAADTQRTTLPWLSWSDSRYSTTAASEPSPPKRSSYWASLPTTVIKRLPVRLRSAGQVGDGLGVGAHDAGGVLGALEVAGRPVDVVGDPRQQHVSSSPARPARRDRRRRPRRSTCPCCRRPATS